jgi:hypothetical protein
LKFTQKHNAQNAKRAAAATLFICLRICLFSSLFANGL